MFSSFLFVFLKWKQVGDYKTLVSSINFHVCDNWWKAMLSWFTERHQVLVSVMPSFVATTQRYFRQVAFVRFTTGARVSVVRWTVAP